MLCKGQRAAVIAFVFLLAAGAAAQSNPAQTASPVFSVASGRYNAVQTLTLTDATPGAVIYYTITGSLITSPAAAYFRPIIVASTETVNAIAIAPGYSRSAAASASYVIAPTASAPTFNVTPGTYLSSQLVSIADSTPGAAIYYTITGTAPGAPSTLYQAPIAVSSSETINAIAVAPGFSLSPAASATYIITPPAATPVFTVASGRYVASQTIAITETTPRATIYYSTSGAAPTTSSPVYTGPILMQSSRTVLAFAVAPGHSPSSVAVGSFSIESPVGIGIPASMPRAFVGAAYTASIQATGGGPAFSWSVNGIEVPATGPPVPIGDGLTAASTGSYLLAITGKPLTAGAFTMNVVVADQFTGSTAGPVPVSIPVGEASQPSLPPPNPASLGPTLTHEPYFGYLVVSGGVAPYSWTVTGLPSPMVATFKTPISTIAGTGSPGVTGDGGPAIAAQIQDAGGVAVDGIGNVYFADTKSGRVRLVTPAGVISTVAGTGIAGYNGDNIPATAARLNNPIGIVVDRSGNLYIADAGNARIRMVSAATGLISTVAGTGTTGYNGDGIAADFAELSRPAGVAVDSSGNIYIADTGNARVREVAADTGAIATLAGSGVAGYSGDGGRADVARLHTPYTVAVDGQGNVYIADLAALPAPTGTGGRIRMVNPASGVIITVAGNGSASFNGDGISATQAALSNPVALAVDGNGNLYIADAGNNRVRSVSSGGVIATVAGNGRTGFGGDNLPAIGTAVVNPAGVAVDNTGNIYVADGTSRIRFVQAPALQSELVIEGTPSTAAIIALQVTVRDAAGAVAGPVTYTIAVTAPLPLTLPVPNPSTLPAALLGQPYTGAITAAGGVPPYTWTASGAAIPGNSVPVPLGSGFTASNTGGNTLSIGGSPGSKSAEPIWVTVRDGMGHSAGPVTYTVNVVGSSGSQVSGQVDFVACEAPAAGVVLTLNTIPAQIVSTDSMGNFSFANVPNGNFTITPSVAVAASTFYPASQTVTVNNGASTGLNFQAAIGYNVSGGVGYTNGIGGRIYLSLINTICPSATLGTSISAPQSFQIHGVQPGTYTLRAWVDELGYGEFNAEDPVFTLPGITVGSANLANLFVSFTQPPPVSLSVAPSIVFAGGYSGGAIVSYAPILDSNGVEQAATYTVQWSLNSTFAAIAGSRTFNATGANGTRVWLLNGLPSRTTFYFRVMGANAASITPWSTVFGPVTIGIPSTGYTVSGTVSFPGPVKGALYVGFRDLTSGMTYTQIILRPVSPQAYSTKVPAGANYAMFALIDQNGDSMADNTDLNGLGNDTPVAITADTTLNFALPASNLVTVTTQHMRQAGQNGAVDSYGLQFSVPTGNMMPLALQVLSGPHILAPVDIGYCPNCGDEPFNYWVNLGSAVPQSGDSYLFSIIDPSGLSATGWGTGPVISAAATVSGTVNAFASNLSPSGVQEAGTTPTFSWSAPANAASYTYQFTLWDASGNVIWQIPGAGGGFPSTITSICWGEDPTGSGNRPSVPTLTPGEIYTWSLQVLDANGNSAEMPVSFTP